MKRLLVVFVFSLAFLNAAVADQGTQRERNNLVGPVKKVFEEIAEFSEKFGNWKEEPRKWFSTVTYDIKGNKIEEGFNEAGTHVYTYDAKNHMIKEAFYGSKGTLLSEKRYTYDERGHRKEGAEYSGGFRSPSSKLVFVTDTKGNITEEAHYSSWTGSLMLKKFDTYDDRGNNTRTTIYSSDGSLYSQFVSTYDIQGNSTEEASYNADGSFRSRSVATYTYDAKGILTSITRYNYSAGGSVDEKEIITLEARGRPIESTAYKADGSIVNKTAYAREYDPRGNWIKQTESRWVTKFGKSYWEPSAAIYRTLTYYEEGTK